MRTPALVLGAGPTGLSAAYHLGRASVLVERELHVGGHCRSIEADGFTFDHAGHIMFSKDPYVHELYNLLLGDNVHWQEREAWIDTHGVLTRYPFQGALYGLPVEVIEECVLGAIEARHGDWRRPLHDLRAGTNGHASANGNGNGHASVHGHVELNGHASRNGSACSHDERTGREGKRQALADCCADGRLEAGLPLVATDDEPRNFEEFIYRVWGAGIAKHFAIPYNRKLWACRSARWRRRGSAGACRCRTSRR